MKTTLNAIKKHSPCIDGYKKLLKFLGKTIADDEVLDLSVILESNGIVNTVWCFRAVEGYEKEKRLFAVFCARQIPQYMNDPKSLAAINVAERFAHGQATAEELTAAYRLVSNSYNSAATYTTSTDASYAANSAYFAAMDKNPEIKPVLEGYLKELLSVK